MHAMSASEGELRARIRELERELEAHGDDVRASRTAAIAGLSAQLGERERAANMYLAAAKHCGTTGQALRAAVLARMAYRTAPIPTSVHDAAMGIWQQCSGEPDSEFYAPGSAN